RRHEDRRRVVVLPQRHHPPSWTVLGVHANRRWQGSEHLRTDRRRTLVLDAPDRREGPGHAPGLSLALRVPRVPPSKAGARLSPRPSRSERPPPSQPQAILLRPTLP